MQIQLSCDQGYVEKRMNFVSLRQYQLSIKAYTLYPITEYKFFSNKSFYFRFLWDILFLILNMSIKTNLQ
jgi:hypothetical protein